MAEKTDLIGAIIEDWQQYDANLKTQGTEVVGRLVRLASLINRQVDENLAQYDLQVGEFDVLAALLRNTAHQLTPSQLQTVILISSGGLSNRINRLEKRGWIERLPDDNDKRGVIVSLTASGKDLITRALQSHLDLENALVAHLTPATQGQMATLLHDWLKQLEG